MLIGLEVYSFVTDFRKTNSMAKVTTGASAVVTKIKKWYLKNNKCKVTNLPPSLRKKGVLCSTHIQLHLAWFSPFTNTPSKIRPATFNARRINGFFFSFFTGKVLRLKLIRLNSHHDRFCRSRSLLFSTKTAELRPATILCHHPREPCTPMKIADARSSNPSFFRPLLNGKKSNQRKRAFFVRKILIS